MRTALTIAGSDSGGGAGIQADLKTFAAHGVYGTSAITAITAQNTLGVTAWEARRADLVTAQIEAVAGDIGADAVKIGMLANAAIVEAVAAAIAALELPHVVVDPVMIAKGGDRLLDEDAVAAMQPELLPLAHIVTPNIPEAEVAGRHADPLDRRTCARRHSGSVGWARASYWSKAGTCDGDRIDRRRAARRAATLRDPRAAARRAGTRTGPAARCRRRSPRTWRSGSRSTRPSRARASISKGPSGTRPGIGGGHGPARTISGARYTER